MLKEDFIKEKIKEIKKYFPVIKKCDFNTVVVYRGKKNLILNVSYEAIYLNGVRINIKKLSKYFLYTVDSIKLFKRSLEECIEEAVGVK